MDPREILKKFSELSSTEQPKAEPLTEAKKPTESGYFTNLVENMAQGQQKPIPVVGKQNDKTQTGVGFLNITDNSPAAQAMQKAFSDMVGQNKAQIVMPTDPQNVPPQAGAQGQNAVKQQNQQGGMMPAQPLREVDSENYTMTTSLKDGDSTQYEVEYRVDGDMVEIVSVHNSYDGYADGDDISGLLSDQELDHLSMKAHEDYEMNQADHADYMRDREEDDAMVADYEQLDEISKDTLSSYLDKANQSLSKARKNYNSAHAREYEKRFGLPGYYDTPIQYRTPDQKDAELKKARDLIDDPSPTMKKHDNILRKRHKGTNRALNKLDPDIHSGIKVPATESEQLDEISKDTLGNYIKQASGEASRVASNAGSYHRAKKDTKLTQRMKGIGNAVDKLSGNAKVPANESKDLDSEIADIRKKINKNKNKVYTPNHPEKKEMDGLKRKLDKLVKQKETTNEGKKDIPYNDPEMKKGREIQDYLDKERANKDKKKQKVKESTMRSNPKISAARHEGKTHGLRGHAYHGKSYEGLEEQQAYHEGYKEGLDECYGSMNETSMPSMPSMPSTPMMEDSNTASQLEAIGAEIIDLAHQAMDLVRGTSEEGAARSYWYPHIVGAVSKDNSYGGGSMITLMDSVMALDAGDDDEYLGEYEGEFDEGNAFIGKLASTKKGDKFEIDGKTYTNTSDRFGSDVFEAWDNQLSDLLNEGLSVSVSQGNEHTPDQVSITATDQDAEELMGLVRNAGLGMFGGAEEPSVSEPMSVQPEGEPEEIGTGAIAIDVGDSDDMLGMLQKLGGIGNVDSIGGDEDYADEEEWGFGSDEQDSGDHEQLHGNDEDPSEEDEEETTEETCNECGGMMEANHVCEESDSEADEEAEAEEDKALAGADSGDEEELAESFFNLLNKVNSPSESEELTEWANQVGKGEGKGTKAQFTQDTEYMTQTIAGGLNKPKSTGQTTTPVITAQMDRTFDSVNDLSKLAGIKK